MCGASSNDTGDRCGPKARSARALRFIFPFPPRHFRVFQFLQGGKMPNKLGYILLADDNANDLELTQRALAQYKLANEIVVVQDGAEALDFLYRRGNFSSRPEIDPLVVLLDI